MALKKEDYEPMESSEAWARRVQRRLRRRGYKVTLLNPGLANVRKETERRQDSQDLKNGISAAKIQLENSLWKGRARSFRIVDYGGLDALD